MNVPAARRLPPRRARRGRPYARRPSRRPLHPVRRRKRRWPRIALLAAAAVLVWALWPGAPQGDAPAALRAVDASAAASPGIPPPASRAPATKAIPVLPTQRTKSAQPASLVRARRDLLLAAIRARADSLRPCVPKDASEVDVPVRLHLTRAGAVKALEFTGAAPPHSLAECLRKVAAGWSFQDVKLPSDVELFATLALGPGA